MKLNIKNKNKSNNNNVKNNNKSKGDITQKRNYLRYGKKSNKCPPQV